MSDERNGWIVELQPWDMMWIAEWPGDPGRTYSLEWAKRFRSLASAKAALTRARRYRPFKGAKIYQFPSGRPQ